MKKLLTAVASVLISSGAFAELKLDPVFSTNMVLQQQKPITFFGTADKGTSVKVEFNGKKVTAQADEKGNWEAGFPAMDAGKTNYTVKISDGKKTIELKDILIGEVWFCSGQSNMQMPIGKKFRRGWSAENCEEEVANAKYPEIRYAYQKSVPSHRKPLSASYGKATGWVKCSPEVAHYFSATAYFFGRKLHQDLNVPIGLINASWGGTRIEPWISPDGYKAFGPEKDQKLYDRFNLDAKGLKAYEGEENKRFIRKMTEWHSLFEKAGAEAKEKAQSWAAADLDDSKWEPGTAKSTRQYFVRWYRTSFKLPNAMKGKTIRFKAPKIGEKVDVYLNGKRIAGWEANVPDTDQKIDISLKADQFDQNGDNVLAIRGEYFRGWRSNSMMHHITTWNTSSLFCGKARIPFNKAKWKMKDEFSCDKKATAGKDAPRNIYIPYKSHQFHSMLYNGMVDSWTKLPVRGVIWYQGCSNAGQLHYYPLHKTLIADWRAKWKNPEMPFIIVQLAGFEPHRAKSWQTSNPNKPSGYALTRDIQLQMLKIPNVGLACAIDIGEAANIHPANKQDVGKRLALEAERIAYGKNIVSRGPLFESAKPEGNSIRVSFKYADKGLKTSDGKAPGAFAVAGEDRKFVWADAKIDGNTVVVTSPEVKEPKYVRYAYAGYRGDCNLQNAEGLPAYPFRSDVFDYSTVK